MRDVHRDAPGIPRSRVVFLLSDSQNNLSFDEISRLFIRMCMVGEVTILRQNELGHERPFAENKRLLFNARDRLGVLFAGVLLKHDCLSLSAGSTMKDAAI